MNTTPTTQKVKAMQINPNNWLWYFKSDVLNNNDYFLIEMDKQLKKQYENRLNKKIDWNKVWLYIEPISDQYVNQIIDSRKCVVIPKALLSFKGNIGSIYVESCLYYYSKSIDEYVTWDRMKEAKDMVFVLKSVANENVERLPIRNNEEQVWHKLETNTKFPVISQSKYLMAECHFIVELDENNKRETIQTFISDEVSKWNEKHMDTINYLEPFYPTKKQFDGFITYYFEPIMEGEKLINNIALNLSNNSNSVKSIVIEDVARQTFR